MASYATSTDIVKYYDERTLKDLVSDSGTAETDLSANDKLTAILSAASGRVDAALRVGGMYRAEDLDALTAESQELLKYYTCMVAMAMLISRRPQKWSKSVGVMTEEVEKILDMFRHGQRVFEVAANIAAGRPTIDGLREADYTRLNLLPDRTRNFYPGRKQRLPIGR